MKTYTIYKITSPNNEVYIGKTTNMKTRMRSHKNKNWYKKSLLVSSIHELGWDVHKVEVIEEFIGDDMIAESKEMFWIRTYMSNRNKWPQMNGFNLTNGGKGCWGHVGPYKGMKRPKGVGPAISKGRFKKVNQYSAEGVFLNQYESGLAVAKALGVTDKMISATALGKRNSCKGYILKYA